jgi:hypothetical protein
MGKALDILEKADLFKMIARQTLERTFKFNGMQLQTFEENYDIILTGYLIELIIKDSKDEES